MESGMNMNMKVAVCFKGTNYLVWSRMVRTTVGSKGGAWVDDRRWLWTSPASYGLLKGCLATPETQDHPA
ncbi:hypothetical protein IGI04_036675 [Brassica rapa subsp. trilocularis]|uniref:Retrotransposon Copia-like N-terminal domain-containing protein n=1 Tax=Brassica rapa subsp. trilocularis TaxID=1813537 RepID=A0ABQ7LGX9_BRACM|nr:hypothetical protein IGI04_036675 [Brassica rapa subsp. trilocularis]